MVAGWRNQVEVGCENGVEVISGRTGGVEGGSGVNTSNVDGRYEEDS